MPCPPEIAEILAEILKTSLLRIRALGWNQNAGRCAVEADHVHNVPVLLADWKPELLDYYWHVERTAFIQNSSKEEISRFEPLWQALAEYVNEVKVPVVSTR